MNGKFYWSDSEESWPSDNGPFNTRVQAVAAGALAMGELYVGECGTHIDNGAIALTYIEPVADEYAPSFYTARRRDADLTAGMDLGTYLVERVEESAAEETGDNGRDFLKYTASCIDRLNDEVHEVLARWIEAHKTWHPWVAEDQCEHESEKSENTPREWRYEVPRDSDES